jgi:cullin-4
MLQSLACGKKRVLEKRPPGRDVNDDDKFRYNPDFTYPRYQVRVDSIQAKETVRSVAVSLKDAIDVGWAA